jgi:hypothetical protein
MRGVMHEFKHGDLHSGSKTGPVVTNRKQAIAIGLSEQRQGGGGKGRIANLGHHAGRIENLGHHAKPKKS